MLIPALVEPTLTEAQICSVTANASGIASISSRSPAEKPFCTKAEKPPRKFTPQVTAAFSKVNASFTASRSLQPAKIMAAGVMEIRLLTMGIPNSFSISSPVLTKSLAQRVIFSYTRSHTTSMSLSQQSSSEIPMVMVRTSRFSSWIIIIVSKISLLFNIIELLRWCASR